MEAKLLKSEFEKKFKANFFVGSPRNHLRPNEGLVRSQKVPPLSPRYDTRQHKRLL